MYKLEGTYRLKSRKLPDGTVVKPPEVNGLLTFTKKYRNFNVMWKDAKGRIISIASTAEYRMTGSKYTEKNISYVINEGKKQCYDLSRESGSSKVMSDKEHAEFKFPLHGEPSAVFRKDKLVATRDGEFEDRWEKVA